MENDCNRSRRSRQHDDVYCDGSIVDGFGLYCYPILYWINVYSRTVDTIWKNSPQTYYFRTKFAVIYSHKITIFYNLKKTSERKFFLFGVNFLTPRIPHFIIQGPP